MKFSQMNTTETKKFFFLFRFVFLRYMKDWMNILFSFIVPIIWLIAAYYIWSKPNPKDGAFLFLMFFTSYSIMPCASIGLVAIPLTFGMDRLWNINKIYSVFNISITKYFLANYISVLIQFLIISNIIMLIGNFAMMPHLVLYTKFMLSASQYFGILFGNIFIFTICFIISIAISNIGKTWAILYSAVLIYFYINLFLSGTVIPAYEIDSNGIKKPSENWFKWIQYLTPLGCGARIDNNIVNNRLWTWNSDWLAIVMPIIESIVSLLAVKKSNLFWNYKKTKISKIVAK